MRSVAYGSAMTAKRHSGPWLRAAQQSYPPLTAGRRPKPFAAIPNTAGNSECANNVETADTGHIGKPSRRTEISRGGIFL